jgi:murein DD-endopeptidase MepM/ murein hydrolase activator NlpD
MGIHFFADHFLAAENRESPVDKKFRISFYPSDASRVKELSMSRRLLLAAAAVTVPLSALGIWLLFAGTLHESGETYQLRKKLAQENRALGERVGKLDEDLSGLRKDLARLEEQKVNALLLSGIGYMEEEKREKSSRLFSFFQDLSLMEVDVAASLNRARALSSSLDSTLAILGGRSSLVEGLPTSYPVSQDAIVTREFGYSPDPFTGRKALHAGVDFSVRAGAPVHATGAGTVVEAGKDLLWGNFVRVDHGRAVLTFYAHLEKVLVKRGQAVARGEAVGLMGMTGVATGVHLHYELTIRGAKADPMRFFLPELILATAMDGAGRNP